MSGKQKRQIKVWAESAEFIADEFEREIVQVQFNRFIFDNYLATEEGKKALSFFKDFENVFCQKKSEEYFDL